MTKTVTDRHRLVNEMRESEDQTKRKKAVIGQCLKAIYDQLNDLW